MVADVTTIKITKKGNELYEKLRKRFNPGMKKQSFIEELCRVYEESRCPECGQELDTRECNHCH